MRSTMAVISGAGIAVAVAGCGGGATHFANLPRPAAPINLTVYIDDTRVSVSPGSVGGGPVVFIVTNSASHTESLRVLPAGGNNQALADTGPISPGENAMVKVDLRPGNYLVSADTGGGSQATQATRPSIQPAPLHLGGNRPSGRDLLLQP